MTIPAHQRPDPPPTPRPTPSSIGVARTARRPRSLAARPERRTCRARLRRSLAGALPRSGVTGKADEVARDPVHRRGRRAVLVLTGLGTRHRPSRAYDAEILRRAAGAATRSLAGRGRSPLALPGADAAAVGRSPRARCSARYVFTGYRSRTAEERQAGGQLVTVLGANPRRGAVKAAAARAEAVGRGHHLDPRPGQHRRRRPAPRPRSPTPPSASAKGAGSRSTVLDEKALRQGRLRRHPRRRPGFDAGRRGWSSSSTRRPRRPSTWRLVGKGITFDSGGLSLKPAGRHGDDEVRHGRRGRRARGDVRPSPTSACRSRSPAGWPSPRTCRPARPSAPPTCMTTYGGRPSRCSTPTPRAGWSWPTRVVAAERGAPGRDRRRRHPHRRTRWSRSARGSSA